MDKHQKAQKDIIDASDKRWQQFRLPKKYLEASQALSAASKSQDRSNGNTQSSNGTQHSGHPEEQLDTNCTPLLVFINVGSGGHVGEELSRYFQTALGSPQVFEIGKECKPEDVLRKVWNTFDKAREQGDDAAFGVRDSIRLLACGGDGTIAWLLSSVMNLKMDPCPASAVVPLGTGNGLSINFGWGKTMRANWIASNDLLLEEFHGVANAEERHIDVWRIEFETPNGNLLDKESVPAAMSVAKKNEGTSGMSGDFCYYFTFGLDAEGAYRFDHLRKTKPNLTKKRKINIFWYTYFLLRTGWFCGASPLREKIAKLEVKDKQGNWLDVKIAPTLRAMVIVNLQTYSGGCDIWGLKDERKSEGVDKGFVSPIFDDGLLEVVGLEGGCKSFGALSGINKNLHGRRLAQANELRITFHSPKEKKGVAMRLDGEPWWQELPDKEGENIMVTIKRSGQAKMLLNTTRLPGVNRKVLAIADREKKMSKPSDKKMSKPSDHSHLDPKSPP